MKSTTLHPNDRLLFEGDSLTEGLTNHYGRLMAWDKTWADRVDEWLFVHQPDLNLECKNLAIGGSSANTLLSRVDAAMAFKPQIVLFTIGTNDCIMKVPVETFRTQIDTWCSKIKSAGCRTIVHIGGFPPCPNVDNETQNILNRCTAYWSAAREIVETHGGSQIDVAPYLLPRAEALNRKWKNHTIYSSGVHYNALGNELIAGAVLSELGFWKNH